MRWLALAALLGGCTAQATIDDGTGNSGDNGIEDPNNDPTDDPIDEPEPEPDLAAGQYFGEMNATVINGWSEGGDACAGEVMFAVNDANEIIEGYGACLFGDQGWGVEGELLGVVLEDGTVEATWLVSLGWGDPVEMPMEGVYAEGHVDLEFSYDSDWFAIEDGTVIADRGDPSTGEPT